MYVLTYICIYRSVTSSFSNHSLRLVVLLAGGALVDHVQQPSPVNQSPDPTTKYNFSTPASFLQRRRTLSRRRQVEVDGVLLLPSSWRYILPAAVIFPFSLCLPSSLQVCTPAELLCCWQHSKIVLQVQTNIYRQTQPDTPRTEEMMNIRVAPGIHGTW